MNILFASPEVAPFAKTGGLADVGGSLPKALANIGEKVTVIMPFYKSVSDLNLDTKLFEIDKFDFLTMRQNNVDYVFLVNLDYYDRPNLYSEPEGDYPDNYLRFSYYCKAITAFAEKSNFKPDIIHCNDWQTGLVPLYIDERQKNTKTLFTIHNIAYQGLFKRERLEEIGIPRKYYNINGIEYYGKISFLKAGIVYSSAIGTVSEGYAREIMTHEFGCGMDGILGTRKDNMYGIPNGVDYTDWDPSIDKYIATTYTSESLEKKTECKKDLIKEINFPLNTVDRPLIGVISRLAEQKGIDLLVRAAKEIIDLGASIVILGTGDAKYNNLTRNIAERYPEYISSNIKFDNALAHKIEAGSDIFVMPSRYEPCGLNQLYSMRYGTLPVVRATGGLDDTVIDLHQDPNNGNGIKFRNAEEEDLLAALSRAIDLYKDKASWRDVQKRIMKLDFSWKKSAIHYRDLYKKLIS